jgi:hypothetical protein
VRSKLITAVALAALVGCTGEIGSGKGGPVYVVDDPDGPGPDLRPIVVAAAAPQVRALSASEYRNTMRDLLGLTVTPNLTQSDWTAGFDNGSNLLIDVNLLAALQAESEALATQYVATRARTDFPCFDPANVADACVQTLIERLGRRAHRRPLTAPQKTELFAFYQSVVSAVDDRILATEMVVARLIASPQLLYRSEVGRAAGPGQELYTLDHFERASLLSYTLTGTMPDEALLADAEAGLLDDTGLRRHIHRLWATPNARARLGDFFRQWLKVTRLEEMARRPEDYPKLPTPAVGASLKAEFDAYVSAVVFDGAGTLPALFSESFTIADSSTAPLYGLTATTPMRLALDPAQRKGVLTLASTMAAFGSGGDPSQDRPVLRGLMVKEQLLCEEVGPPSNVNTAAAASTAMLIANFDQLTTREQYEAMMQRGEDCKSCHRQFMPMGFALGAYDALGRHRTEQRGRPVNTAVTNVPFAGKTLSFDDGTDLAEAVAGSRAAADCFGRNFVAFTVGAAHTEHSETLSGSLMQKMGTGPLGFLRFVEETLTSPHLYTRRGLPYVEPPPHLPPPPPPPMRSVLLASGGRLDGDASVTSHDGAFRLLYPLDGNLVLYRTSGGAVWSSATNGQSVGRTEMQADGNLVVYDRDGTARFHTFSHGNPGAQLFIEPNGRLHVVATDGRTLWSSP